MLAKAFNNNVEMTTYLIPYDLQDGFFFSAWRYPERYLDMTFCNGISSLAETSKDILIKTQEKLRNDLNSGYWKSKYWEKAKELLADLKKNHGNHWIVKKL